MESRVSAALVTDPSKKTEVGEKRLHDSCRDFSSVLVSFMMKTMRAGYSGGDEPSFASGVYQDMLDQQVSKVIARSGTLGLGDKLYAQVERLEKTKASQKPPGAGAEAQKAVSSQLFLNKVGNSAE